MLRIAIDGPGGAGKSTIAKAVAKELFLDYIDTGAMYRAIGYKLAREKVDLEDQKALQEMLDVTDIDFSSGNIILDGEIVNDKIRTPEMSKMASSCSGIKAVREKLVSLQRRMGENKSLIMDGRDIGNNVLPHAEFKFFITAAPEERARRRYAELLQKGDQVTFEEVLADMNERDEKDRTRALNPLRKAEDAIEIDTTKMSIEEVIGKIIKEVK
ncbi:MAG: (d)CMP kinase [Anaerovoracaceae bacterium]